MRSFFRRLFLSLLPAKTVTIDLGEFYVTACSCFGCDAFTEDAEAEEWGMGHLDGEGHYVCPGCFDAVWDPYPLTPIKKRS